jgi:hypothetical protein
MRALVGGAFAVALSSVIGAQGPRPPTLLDLQALALDVVEGALSTWYSRTIARGAASGVARRVSDCRSLYEESGRLPIVLTLLQEEDWNRVTPFPYGMPHHSAIERPFIVVIPWTWKNASPMVAGTRDRIAAAIGPDQVDRYLHLAALHEIGHIITYGVLNQKTSDVLGSRFPFWYVEFVANYFADSCLALQPAEAALFRRAQAALLGIPRQKYSTLDDWDRLMTDRPNAGQPFFLTEAGALNFARYQGLTGVMASRVRDTGYGSRLVPLIKAQWSRLGRQSTDDLLRDFGSVVPDWPDWLAGQGAIQR